MKTIPRARFVLCFTLLGGCSLGVSGIGASGSGSSSAASGMGGAAASSSSSASSGGGGAGGAPMEGATCLAIHQAYKTAPNGVYTLDPDGPDGGTAPFKAYCEMVADGGGWTLALKIDGTQPTFHYTSQLWQNESTYQPEQPDLDTTEAKLASFSRVSFNAVRLGMIDTDMTTRWIRITLPSTQTLFSLIMGGNYTKTTIGPGEWKKLVASPSMQSNCNVEGFNVDPSSPATYARARIGIVANEQPDCTSPDSFIGFGAYDGHTGYGTGNFASYMADKGNRTTQTFGYVMVR